LSKVPIVTKTPPGYTKQYKIDLKDAAAIAAGLNSTRSLTFQSGEDRIAYSYQNSPGYTKQYKIDLKDAAAIAKLYRARYLRRSGSK